MVFPYETGCTDVPSFSPAPLATLSLPLSDAVQQFLQRPPHAETRMLAAYTAYLARLNRETVFDLGWLEAGQIYPFRVAFDLEQPFTVWWREVWIELQRLRTHQRVRSPFPQSNPFPLQIGWDFDSMASSPMASAAGLTLLMAEQSWTYRWTYPPQVFSPEAVERLRSDFLLFLDHLAIQPDRPLSQIPLLSEAQAQIILQDWNASPSPAGGDRCIQALFEEQVERTPEAIALVYEQVQISYRQLNARANQLAHHLLGLGVEPDQFVGLCVERSPELIIGLLGILKAGAAYLPLDPGYPAERLALMIEDAQPQVIVTQGAVQDRLPQGKAQLVNLADPDPLPQTSSDNPTAPVQPWHLAYIIYTSGSTGKPKGVMIEHRALVNFVQAAREQYGIGATDRVLQFASVSFDAAAEEIYPCLTVGGRLVLRSPHWMGSIPQFLQRCQDQKITVLDLPTAYWHLMVAELKADPGLCLPRSLRRVIIGGEAVDPERVVQWQDILRRTQVTADLVNTYGPTEATVVATASHLPAPRGQSSRNAASVESPGQGTPRMTIGRPLPGVRVYVLDDRQQPVPLGLAGELCIGGGAIARGYLNRPELTAQRFLPDPFLPAPFLQSATSGVDNTTARLYRTGDLVRYLPHGEIDFLGRVDSQVKLRGFRIELGGIEARLSQDERVQASIVILREDPPREPQLVAYVVPHPTRADAGEFSTQALRQRLQATLPDYMVPAAIVCLPALPLTPNNKIDRRALPAPSLADFQADEDEFIPPLGELEIQLAELWQSILGLPQVGATDHFFQLGGNSLLAIKLFVQIERRLGQSLQLSALLQAPTPRKLAQRLSQTAGAEASAPVKSEFTTVVPFHPKGSQPPLFFINSISYARRLSSQLGEEQPFYCLNLFGITDLLSSHLTELSLANIAQRFVQDIQRVNPTGPYWLCSYCGDTKLAIEIGHQLQANPFTPVVQILIDPLWDEPIGSQPWVQNLQRFGLDYGVQKLQNRIRIVREQVNYRSRQLAGRWLNSERGAQLQKDLDLYDQFRALCDRHQPQPYAGPVTVISCQELASWDTPRLRATFPQGFNLRIVPGYHHNLFVEPQLQQLVREMQLVLAPAAKV